MQAERGKVEDVLPSDFREHPHTSITFMRPYTLRMRPHAVRMHFLPASKKPMKSRAERASKKPYALYAPLLGVGVFSAFFLLREPHTVHTTAYGRRWNWLQPYCLQALGHLLPAKTESAYGSAYGFSPISDENARR